MSIQETGPLKPRRMTAPLDETHVTPREIILNAVIDQYIDIKKRDGEPVTAPHTNNEGINWVLSKYCEEHEGLTAEEKAKVRQTIETIFDIRVNRNKGDEAGT
mgnify:FL=1